MINTEYTYAPGDKVVSLTEDIATVDTGDGLVNVEIFDLFEAWLEEGVEKKIQKLRNKAEKYADKDKSGYGKSITNPKAVWNDQQEAEFQKNGSRAAKKALKCVRKANELSAKEAEKEAMKTKKVLREALENNDADAIFSLFEAWLEEQE